MERLTIYFHYDPQGRVDAAARLAVQAMLKFGALFFVTNGALQPEDRAWVRQAGAQCLERANTGYDVGAYREALLTLGRAKVEGYQELILMNYTLAGPVSASSLQALFARMDADPALGFWGLTRHYAMKSSRFGGHVPEHLQSHFLAVRQSLLRSDAFWDYWQKMPLPKSYEQSIILHETQFTAHFAALGFAWTSAVPTDDLKPIFVNPIMACPRVLVQERGCPFFKRRSFFTPYADEMRRTDGLAARELYDYLKAETSYPVDLLVASLLRTQPLAAMAQNLHWHTTLTPQAAQTAPDLQALGLQLIRFPLPQADAVTEYYWRQTAQQADALLPQAAALFAADPMLGIVSPAQPLWQGADAARRRQWRADRAAVAQQIDVPLSTDPPPVPNDGWALVRTQALGGAVPPCNSARDAWLLPLLAQKNGYTCRTFAAEARSAACADVLAVAADTLQTPAATAKQLGRLAKHRLAGQK